MDATTAKEHYMSSTDLTKEQKQAELDRILDEPRTEEEREFITTLHSKLNPYVRSAISFENALHRDDDHMYDDRRKHFVDLALNLLTSSRDHPLWSLYWVAEYDTVVDLLQKTSELLHQADDLLHQADEIYRNTEKGVETKRRHVWGGI
jgi:hypothetical protein